MLTNTLLQSASLWLTIASSASAANFVVKNWCLSNVTMMISQNAGCDTGMDGTCGSAPWQAAQNGTFAVPLVGSSVSLKMAKQDVGGVLQYEYSYSDGQYGGLYWDLSDLDGSGPGLVGTPFATDNVRLTPSGDGVGTGTCLSIYCAANQVCLDSYQHSDDANTRYCPVDTGDMTIDLCLPDGVMSTSMRKARSVEPELDAPATVKAARGFHSRRSSHRHARHAGSV